MKSTARRIHCLFPLYTLLCIGVCLLSASVSAEQPDLARQLMLQSGLISQLNTLHDALGKQLEQVMKKDKSLKTLSPNKKMHIESWLHSSYSPQRLIRSIHDYYYENLSDQEMEQILRWINSGAGRRFTEMEKIASSSTAANDMWQFQQAHPADSIPQNRQKLIERLNRVTKVSESALLVKLTSRLATALIKQESLAKKKSVAELMKQISKQRDDLLSEILPEVIPGMTYTYRRASDLELQSYISFAESKIGMVYHTTMLSAFNNALIEASQDFGHVLLAEY